MKTRSLYVLAVLGVAIFCAQPSTSFAQGTTFTYQGHLLGGGGPAQGSYDLAFSVWNAASGPAQVGGTITNANTAVSNGLFTVTLDFGAGVFTGAGRWLEIAARTNGGSAFVTLAPRQPFTAAPYAIFAGGAEAGGITGILPNGSLAGGYLNAVQFLDPGNQFVGAFIGDGTGLFNVSATTLNGKTDADFWQLAGNAGTTGADFVGTTDNQPLELRAFNQRALLLEPRPGAPNLVGGNGANATAPGVTGAVIGGGGTPSAPNQAAGPFSVIAGGFGNLVALESVIGGGVSNLATGGRVVIAGGALNAATNGLGVVSGGRHNIANGYASVAAGGLTNRATGDWSAVSGGHENIAADESATASGGVGNQSLGEYSTVGGGTFNTADFPASTVSGGQENAALNQHATVGGGVGNYAVGDKSTIGGGANNQNTGPYATVPGGKEANPTQLGQVAHASGMFLNPGDAQHSIFVMRTLTDIANPLMNLTLDGGGTQLRLEPNHTLAVHVLVVARAEPPLTDSAGYEFRAVVKNKGGGAAFVGPPLGNMLGQDVPFWSATLNVIGDALVVSVDGGGAAGYPATVRWVARVDAAEVAW